MIVLEAGAAGIFYMAEMRRRAGVPLVLAHIYRGPEARKYVQALAAEIRVSFGLASRTSEVSVSSRGPAFAVIVDGAKSDEEAQALCLMVRKIAPSTPLTLSGTQKTLTRAFLTSNAKLDDSRLK